MTGYTPPLFAPSEALRRVSEHWCEARDANTEAEQLFLRHYSATKNRARRHRGFVGPGEKMVLLSVDGQAVFAWRKEVFRMDAQQGVNCTIFRNEGPVRSSVLVREASDLAHQRWPGERLFTFVDSRRVRSINPGCCFKRAGWRTCGTSAGGLIVLEAAS